MSYSDSNYQAKLGELQQDLLMFLQNFEREQDDIGVASIAGELSQVADLMLRRRLSEMCRFLLFMGCTIISLLFTPCAVPVDCSII